MIVNPNNKMNNCVQLRYTSAYGLLVQSLRLRDTIKHHHTCVTIYRYFSALQQCITSSDKQRVLYCIHLRETLLSRAFVIYSPVRRVANNENLLAKKQHIQVFFHQFKELD